jgi:riboflavin synthase
MFTGIVTEMGAVAAIDRADYGRRLAISCDGSLAGLRIGDSVAVNGVCLTVVDLDADGFAVEAVEETLARSNLGSLTVGAPVDLERPMPADGRFDGHIVQGHVDAVGRVLSVTPEGTARRIRIAAPRDLGAYLVEKGSVTVDGVSLTVTAVSSVDTEGTWFEMVIIPHTLHSTVFGTRVVGDEVNLEVDVIAKYVERMVEAHR